MAASSDQAERKLINEAVRRVLVSEEDVTIDADKLRQILEERYLSGNRDLSSLVKLGQTVVHSNHRVSPDT